MLEYDENITLGELFGLIPDDYSELDVTSLPFSIRVTNRLSQTSIKTVKDLLGVTTAFLMGISGFGSNCLTQIYSYFEKLAKENPDQNDKPLTRHKENPILIRFKDMIALGDFSFSKEEQLSDSELVALEKYKKAYEILGEELVFDCVCSMEHIVPIIRSLEDFIKRTKRTQKLVNILKTIPKNRQQSRSKYFIEAYSYDDDVRERIALFYASENAELASIIYTIDADESTAVVIAERFLKWCAYDLKAQIADMFENLYANERIKQIVEARAQGQTLSDVGNRLNITRERVRQIESKAIRKFARYQWQIKLMKKLYAEQNGQSIIALETIEEVGAANAAALIFLLRQTESAFYTYDTMIDAFVIGENDVATRVQDYIDSLPDVIRKRDISGILEVAKQEDDLNPDYLEKAINESYKLTGAVYHKKRLSLARIYEEVLREHYPEGIHIYDDSEIAQFRCLIAEEYGDIALPENNRAIVARLASVGTLAGRGIYIAKRKKWISKELEEKIRRYIENHKSPVLLIGMIFTEFEDKLTAEGIDNRYFLQGVLRELFGDQFYFRRDYVSRDKGFTSIYSSIIAFISQHQYPVKKEEIQARFKGITDVVIAFATSDSNILNYFGEYLHGSRLNIHEDERRFLFNWLGECLSDNEAHHIKDICPALLEAKPEVFSRNAANMPYCIFSVLEYLFRDRFRFSRPYIARNGVAIGRPIERLIETIYGEDEFLIGDISDFCRENHVQIQSISEFVNSLNDKFLMKSIDSLISIKKAGINEDIAMRIEIIIREEISETMPIRNLMCISRFPWIRCDWSEWLIYSIINKWGASLEVALSSPQLRQSMPLIAPKGKMDVSSYNDVITTPVSIKVDNLDNIDELISDLITEDMLEDI